MSKHRAPLIQFSVRLPATQLEYLNTRSEKEGRAVSEILRDILAAEMKNKSS